MTSAADSVRSLLRDFLLNRKDVTLLACKQRAKFEGWFKFELASALARHNDFTQITLEDGYPNGGRSDISFLYQGVKCYVELKTANTNWRAEGLENITRPVTRNVDGIIDDIHVLKKKSLPDRGMAIFLLFPVPVYIWETDTKKLKYHINRIENETQMTRGSLMNNTNFVQVAEKYGICSFVVEVN